MRIDIEKCNDIEMLRREAIRLTGVIDSLMENAKSMNETNQVIGKKAKEANEENIRWRETHKNGEWNPDYCAAKEALKDTIKMLKKANDRVEEYKAMLHLMAHDVVFVSVRNSTKLNLFFSGGVVTSYDNASSEESLNCFEGKQLEFFGYINDTFGYASSDCEQMTLSEAVKVYKDACVRFSSEPWIAVALWAQKKLNGQPFIEPVQKLVEKALEKTKK